MAVRYLLDTNLCIYIAQHNPPAVRARFERHSAGDLAMSIITQGELRHGAEKSLARASEVGRRRYIQWSIFQHYEVCPTPLLDFSQSVRVACSFATLDPNGEDAYVFAFGLRYITNRIAVNSEHDLVNIRLLSLCPPDARRPYFQEGYLAGTDEVTTEFGFKDELDFTRRLIAKFRTSRDPSFWEGGFDPIPPAVFHPDGDWMGLDHISGAKCSN